MVSEYNKQITDNMRIRMKQIGFNQLEITTLASIIEGEAIFDSERKKISTRSTKNSVSKPAVPAAVMTKIWRSVEPWVNAGAACLAGCCRLVL